MRNGANSSCGPRQDLGHSESPPKVQLGTDKHHSYTSHVHQHRGVHMHTHVYNAAWAGVRPAAPTLLSCQTWGDHSALPLLGRAWWQEARTRSCISSGWGSPPLRQLEGARPQVLGPISCQSPGLVETGHLPNSFGGGSSGADGKKGQFFRSPGDSQARNRSRIQGPRLPWDQHSTQLMETSGASF